MRTVTFRTNLSTANQLYSWVSDADLWLIMALASTDSVISTAGLTSWRTPAVVDIQTTLLLPAAQNVLLQNLNFPIYAGERVYASFSAVGSATLFLVEQ